MSGTRDENREIELTARDEEYPYTQIKPGQTVFEVLKEKATSDGMILFALPSGKIVFGEPAKGGKAQYFLTTRKDGRNNNILSANLCDDISRRYKTVTVLGQKQGGDAYGSGQDNLDQDWNTLISDEFNLEATVTDPTFPFNKPFVAMIEHDSQDLEKYARLLMNGMLFEGWHLEIKTFGHSQNGKVYQVNEVYHVQDEVLGINQDLLCYSRTFEKSKQGVFTTLKLSKLGLLPS